MQGVCARSDDLERGTYFIFIATLSYLHGEKELIPAFSTNICITYIIYLVAMGFTHAIDPV